MSGTISGEYKEMLEKRLRQRDKTIRKLRKDAKQLRTENERLKNGLSASCYASRAELKAWLENHDVDKGQPLEKENTLVLRMAVALATLRNTQALKPKEAKESSEPLPKFKDLIGLYAEDEEDKDGKES